MEESSAQIRKEEGASPSRRQTAARDSLPPREQL